MADEGLLKMSKQNKKYSKFINDLFDTTIRQQILLHLVIVSVAYCLLSLFVLRIILVVIKLWLVSYLSVYSVGELYNKFDSGYYHILFTIWKYIIYILYDYNILFILIYSTLFIWIYTSKSKVSIICPHCLKTILFKNITNVHCLLCDTGEHSRFELLLYCSSCRESIDYFDCPHCCHSINITEKYDHEELKNKRREKAKIKPSYLTGLRELYNRKKRLPQFICKHCLKTLITKNYNLTCPHCDAKYLVTDNRTQVQVGDVKIKDYRYIGDESTMERVLFDSCIQCGGMIEVIECYHPNCKIDIDLREDYDEIELLRRRYEQEKS